MSRSQMSWEVLAFIRMLAPSPAFFSVIGYMKIAESVLRNQDTGSKLKVFLPVAAIVRCPRSIATAGAGAEGLRLQRSYVAIAR